MTRLGFEPEAKGPKVDALSALVYEMKSNIFQAASIFPVEMSPQSTMESQLWNQDLNLVHTDSSLI